MSTTPAMSFPRALTMPEAVRISVSMRSFSTGARAGKAVSSSAAVAERQEDFGCALSSGDRVRLASREKRISFMVCVSLEMYDTALEGDGCGVSAIAYA